MWAADVLGVTISRYSQSSSSSRGLRWVSVAKVRSGELDYQIPTSRSKAASSTAKLSQKRGPTNAFDLGAHELGIYARRLAKQSYVGGDPAEQEATWDAVAFQAQGLAEELSVSDVYMLIRALSTAKVLWRHTGAQSALLQVLRRDGVGVLKPHKVVSLWVALDRADVDLDADTAAFFQEELRRALPLAVPPLRAEGSTVEERGAGSREWQRLNSLLTASGCAPAELQRVWELTQEAALADGGAVRALSVSGLISALRAGALVQERGLGQVAGEFRNRLSRHLGAQARWLDGWAASHAAHAAARLRIAPGAVYDNLRPAILDRCVLSPPRRGLASAHDELSGLAESQRIAAALAHFDVHDAEVRGQLASWLLQPLPAKRLAQLALDLAGAGLSDASDQKVARHVRARARSSELSSVVGADVAEKLLHAYSQAEAA